MPHGERDERWLCNARRAHSVSFAVWQSVEKVVEGYCLRYGEDSPCRILYIEALKFYKDPQYLASIEEEHGRIQAILDEKHDLQVRFISTLSTDQDTSAIFERLELRQKPKTRPAASTGLQAKHETKTGSTSQTEDGSLETGSTAEPLPVLYTLTEAEIKIIDHIFPTHEYMHHVSKTIFDWKVFVALMTKLDFGVQGLTGSAHRFGGEVNTLSTSGSRNPEDPC